MLGRLIPLRRRFAESWGGPQAQLDPTSAPDPFLQLDLMNLKYFEPHPAGGGPWYDIIDVKQVLCFLPLVPNFEDLHNTIPGRFANRKAHCYPNCGAADKANPGSGSRLWYVNSLALVFGSKDKLLGAMKPEVLSKV